MLLGASQSLSDLLAVAAKYLRHQHAELSAYGMLPSVFSARPAAVVAILILIAYLLQQLTRLFQVNEGIQSN